MTVTPVWLTAPEPARVASDLAVAFQKAYGPDPDGSAAHPDGVWSAPGRVNLIGEHTDYNQGLCFPMALRHRTFAAVRLRSDDAIRVRSLQSPDSWVGTLDDVGRNKPASWVAYVVGVLWALREKGIHIPGLDVLVDGRVPLGSGLSSSAALECAVAAALRDLLPAVGELSLDELAAACVTAENVVAGANTGGMDQAISLGAQEGRAMLLDCRDMSARQVPWTLSADGWELLVMDTRAPHQLVDGQYAERRATCEAAARTLGVAALRDVSVAGLDDALTRLDPLSQKRVRHIVTEIDRTATAAEALHAADVAALGALMTASHASMRDDYEISCPELDLAVDTALAHGSPGARMTGGGFGGSAIALVRSGAADTTAQAVADAFEAGGFAAPQFLVVTPGGPAARES